MRVSGFERTRRRRSATTRLRAGLRRHGVIPCPAALRDLLRASDVRFTRGNRVELFREGRSALDAMLAAVQAARHRVHLESYIFRADETGRRFLSALAERARAGVEVRLLVDGVGSRGLLPAALAELREAGGDAVVFNPLGRIWPRWLPRRRDHRKILIVDDEVGFMGGLNIGDEYYSGAPLGGGRRIPWRDAHLCIRGPAVSQLGAVFLESWFRADGPDHPDSMLPEPIADTPGGEALGLLPDGPTYHRRRMRELLIRALERARERACLVTPYFVPDGRLRRALADAAARGVRVDVLIAGWSDHPILRWAARARLPELLAKGVRCYEFETAMLHAKLAVFDDCWAIVGTSNLDRQSLHLSYEVNLLAEGGELPHQLTRLVDEDLAVACAITLESLSARLWWARLRDRTAALLIGRL
jgi:cardiolipin synthase